MNSSSQNGSSAEQATPGPPGISVTDLFIYPIKSCGGIRLERADVGSGGFEGDRRWMIVDDAGHFVTQRTLPSLCRLLVSRSDGGFRVRTDGQPSHELPFGIEQGSPTRVVVWNDTVDALEHAPLSRWLSETLGGNYRGVFIPSGALRRVSPKRARPEDRVGFADAYPFLLASRESLAEVVRRAGCDLQMERFRPNIVVSGCARHHDEDNWHTLRIGGVPFRMAKLCDRCTVTTVDPQTGDRGKEPLRTLSTYRRWDGKVWFGVNLIHDDGGSVCVGDSVVIDGRIP